MVMKMLQEQKKLQAERKIAAGSLWDDKGVPGLVFTNPFGGHYVHNTVTHNITRSGARIGVEGLRFHDLRHTYAVASLRAGDDVKTVQSNLGHVTAAFTLDRYAHYTTDMRKDSAARMEAFMSGLEGL
jgi:integrase